MLMCKEKPNYMLIYKTALALAEYTAINEYGFPVGKLGASEAKLMLNNWMLLNRSCISSVLQSSLLKD